MQDALDGLLCDVYETHRYRNPGKVERILPPSPRYLLASMIGKHITASMHGYNKFFYARNLRHSLVFHTKIANRLSLIANLVSNVSKFQKIILLYII